MGYSDTEILFRLCTKSDFEAYNMKDAPNLEGTSSTANLLCPAFEKVHT